MHSTTQDTDDTIVMDTGDVAVMRNTEKITIPELPSFNTHFTIFTSILFLILAKVLFGFTWRTITSGPFIVSWLFIFALSALADHRIIKFVATLDATLDACRNLVEKQSTFIGSKDEKLERAFAYARKKLQNYKDTYAKAKRERDDAYTEREQALTDAAAALKDSAAHADRLIASKDDHLATPRKRISDRHALRKKQIDMCIEYYNDLLSYHASVSAEFDKLVKKFRNVSVPKVKGVTLKKSNSNSLTAPLERLLGSLNAAQEDTRKRIRVAEKIAEILSTETGDVDELYKKVARAEKALKAEPDGVFAGGEGDGGVDLQKNFEQLNVFYKSVAGKSAEEDDVGEVEVDE